MNCMEQNINTQNNSLVKIPNSSLGQTIATIFLFLLFLCVGFLFYQNYQINNKLKSLEGSIMDKKVVIPNPTITPTTTFRSNANKFEVMLPLNWYGHEADQLRDVWFSYPVDDFSTIDADPNSKVVANLISSVYKPENTIKDDLIKRSKIDEGINSKQLYDPDKAESLTFGGRFGFFVTSDDQKYAVALIDHEDSRYIFTLGTEDPSLVFVFKQILLSIKFI